MSHEIEILNENLPEDEILYRAVRRMFCPKSFSDEGIPKCHLFRNKKGLSVDRKKSRTEKEVIEGQKLQFPAKEEPDFITAVKISVRECIEVNTLPIADPLVENEYHCLIKDSVDDICISIEKAALLAKKCKVVECN